MFQDPTSKAWGMCEGRKFDSGENKQKGIQKGDALLPM